MEQKELYLIKVTNYPNVRVKRFKKATTAFSAFEKYAGEEELCGEYIERSENGNFLRLKVKENKKNVVALFKKVNLNK